MTDLPPITEADVARAARGLDHAHHFVQAARATLNRANDGPTSEAAARELARAEAGVAYAALVLRCQEQEIREAS